MEPGRTIDATLPMLDDAGSSTVAAHAAAVAADACDAFASLERARRLLEGNETPPHVLRARLSPRDQEVVPRVVPGHQDLIR